MSLDDAIDRMRAGKPVAHDERNAVLDAASRLAGQELIADAAQRVAERLERERDHERERGNEWLVQLHDAQKRIAELERSPWVQPDPSAEIDRERADFNEQLAVSLARENEQLRERVAVYEKLIAAAAKAEPQRLPPETGWCHAESKR